VKLIENPDNRGFPAGCNQGIRTAGGDQILLLK
jgi:GT2 family glycosyltransferase